MNKTMQNILIGLFTAIVFSAFIYFEHFELTNKLVNTVLGLSALGFLLYIPKQSVLSAGFFIGLLWFYWIGYSFEYQGVGYMTPIIFLAFGFIYLIFFSPLYFTNKPIIRALLLFGLSFVEPFDWNWLQIELIFIDSYISVLKYPFAFVLLALSLPSLLKQRYKLVPILLLAFAFNYGYPVQKDAPLKIKLVPTNIKQEVKWKQESLQPTIESIFKEIRSAINKEYDVIVFPESVFPIFMNHNHVLMNELLTFSKDITIIAGSLLEENGNHYNVTYMFQDGKYELAKKMVLVPFGEYIPLPKFAQKIINDTFFSGTSDFLTASEPTDFLIKNVKFRNAICYEATCQEIYDGDVDFVLATSNNAWFAPSIEPTLQTLLMKYYGRKNGVTIYHSANFKGTGVIK